MRMTAAASSSRRLRNPDALSLYHLLEPGVLANPYPLYHRLQSEDPVHWDPFLHTWVVTRYADVLTVLQKFSARCAPSPEDLAAMGLSDLNPIAEVMVRQMLFMDAPTHTWLRAIASQAFTPARLEVLRSHIRDIVDSLLDLVQSSGQMDILEDLGNPLPAIVTAEMLGVPPSDHKQLKAWSTDFAEILGNFQHNSDRVPRMLRSLQEMSGYFRAAIRRQLHCPGDGLIKALLNAQYQGERLSEDAIVANCILLMVGGQETTPNLIGNGALTLLRNPDQMHKLRADSSMTPSAVEELLRYESPSQHTTRVAPEDIELGGKLIRKHQSVIAVMGAANRDPEKFPNPDRVDVGRKDNRHLAFGGGAHFCFGAPLARIEGQIAFEGILRRMPDLALEPGPLVWRSNHGLRGLTKLAVKYEPTLARGVMSVR